jgi:hypothetical protein
MKTKKFLFLLPVVALFFSCQKELDSSSGQVNTSAEDLASSAGFSVSLDSANCSQGYIVPGATITDAWRFTVPQSYSLNGVTFHANNFYELAMHGTPAVFVQDGPYWSVGLSDLHIPIAISQSVSFDFVLKDNIPTGTYLGDTLCVSNFIDAADNPIEALFDTVAGLSRLVVQTKPTVSLFTAAQLHAKGTVIAGIAISADQHGNLSVIQIPIRATLLNVKTKMTFADAQLISEKTGEVVSKNFVSQQTGEGSWNITIKCKNLSVAAGTEERFVLVKPYRATGMAAVGISLGEKDKFVWNDGVLNFGKDNKKFLPDSDFTGFVYVTL